MIDNRSQLEMLLKGFQNENPRLYDFLKLLLESVNNNLDTITPINSGLDTLSALIDSGVKGSYLQTNLTPAGQRASRNIIVWTDPLTSYDFAEDFDGDSRFTPINTGTATTNAFGTSGIDSLGAVALATGTTNGSIASMVHHRTGHAALVDPILVGYLCFRVKFRDTTFIRAHFGFSNNISIFTPTNAVYWRIDTFVDQTVKFVTRAAGVETATTVHTPSNNVWYKYEFFVITGIFTVYLDNVLILTQSTNIPATLAANDPGIAITNTVGVDKILDIDYYRLTVPGLVR